MERLQQLETIEKDISNAIQSAGCHLHIEKLYLLDILHIFLTNIDFTLHKIK